MPKRTQTRETVINRKNANELQIITGDRLFQYAQDTPEHLVCRSAPISREHMKIGDETRVRPRLNKIAGNMHTHSVGLHRSKPQHTMCTLALAASNSLCMTDPI